MKGLFYKEARSLWHFGKTYLLILVIFWARPVPVHGQQRWRGVDAVSHILRRDAAGVANRRR